ncbi:MAG TPA: PEP-CTERM sorting domain-containing protein, partial [Novosphingobium sp.]|nr:PEP-CTERM sorting domain-containing protein [Novosphingobium sp.]
VGGVTASNIFFSTPMSGITYIGLHWGNVDDENNVSAFFKLNLAPGTTHISLDNSQGFSNAALYSTVAAVPEASTWAMMLVGLGGVAWALRRKRQVSTTARISFA